MLYRSKLDFIGKYVKGKRVLDLGCVCHQLDIAYPPWLHGYICERADSVLGVDVLEAEIEELNRRGYHVVYADVEAMDLGEQFDVVVAGDLVEHLTNHADFLRRVSAHLKPDGVFVMTTPNPITLLRYMRLITGGETQAHHEHTCWFTAKVFRQMAERFGLEVVDESYADDTRIHYVLWPRISNRGGPIRRTWRRIRALLRRLIWRPWIYLNSLICLFRPRAAETLCLALRRRDDGG